MRPYGGNPNLRFHNHPFRLAAAGTNSHNSYAMHSGPPEYSNEPTGSNYDYHQPGPPPGYMPTGGSYHYHATGPSTGYGSHPEPPPIHPPVSSNRGKSKKSGHSSLTALTLLSFFFFVNLLQNCLKDHMTAMNPTVMVMTAGFGRKSFNKLGDVNSRERTSTASAATLSSPLMDGSIIVASSAPNVNYVTPAAPAIGLMSPYSGNSISMQPQQHAQELPAIYSNHSVANYNFNNVENPNSPFSAYQQNLPQSSYDSMFSHKQPISNSYSSASNPSSNPSGQHHSGYPLNQASNYPLNQVSNYPLNQVSNHPLEQALSHHFISNSAMNSASNPSSNHYESQAPRPPHSNEKPSPWVYEPSSFGSSLQANSPYSSTKRFTANGFFDVHSKKDDYEERYERIN